MTSGGRPTQEEMRELMNAGGGLYEILGLTEHATQDDIKKQFRKLAKQYHPDKVGKDSPMMVEINKAYKILSNERMRELYDTYSIEADGSVHHHDHEARQELMEILEMTVTLLIQFAATPFKMVSVVGQATAVGSVAHGLHLKHNQSSWQITSESLRHKRSKGIFRGTLTSIVTVIAADQVSQAAQKQLYKYLSAPISVMRPLSFLLKCAIEYPFEICSNIYMVDRSFNGATQVLRSIVSKNGVSGLWRGLPVYVGMSLISGLIDYGITKLQQHTYSQYLNNTQSKLWRYSNFILSNPISRTTLFTLCMTPVFVVSYSVQMKALLTGSTSPVSIIKELWKGGNFIKNIYSGLIPLTIYLSSVEA